MTDLKLSCKCGCVTGEVRDIKPGLGNRVICYCKDCQSFASELGKVDVLLNQSGGTSIYQVPPSHVHLKSGLEHLKCLRLTQKGLYRWYCGRCETPVANTLSATFPLIGVLPSFVAEKEELDRLEAPIYGSYCVDDATAPIPHDMLGEGRKWRVSLFVVTSFLKWKLLGKSHPNPFYQESGLALTKPRIVRR